MDKNIRNHAIQFSKREEPEAERIRKLNKKQNMPLLNRSMKMILVKTT